MSLMEPARRRVTVLRVVSGTADRADDMTAAEEPLEVRLNGRPFAVIMRTPGSDPELVAGFLLAEGVVRSSDELGTIEHCRETTEAGRGNTVNATVLGEAADRLQDVFAERRQVVTSAACGMCGRRQIESLQTLAPRVTAHSPIAGDVIRSLPARLRARQSTFDETGGLHAAALFDFAGRLELSAEDIGRHNAVDKVIGRMLMLERVPLDDRVLFVSGRTSFEIVQKAVVAGVPVVGAVSAPSSLAVDLAVEMGVTLLGFVRDERFNVYSHPERIDPL
jgi:FdhD protein